MLLAWCSKFEHLPVASSGKLANDGSEEVDQIPVGNVFGVLLPADLHRWPAIQQEALAKIDDPDIRFTVRTLGPDVVQRRTRKGPLEKRISVASGGPSDLDEGLFRKPRHAVPREQVGWDLPDRQEFGDECEWLAEPARSLSLREIVSGDIGLEGRGGL